jgi:hypothetical protein
MPGSSRFSRPKFSRSRSSARPPYDPKKLKLYFRGDSRPPAEIFASGFEKQDQSSPIAFNYYEPPNSDIVLDVVVESAVCISSRFQGAMIFPLRSSGTYMDSHYCYLVAVDIDAVTNTHLQQVSQALAQVGKLRFRAADIEEMLSTAFVQEAAVDSIPPEQIIGAISFSRRFLGPRGTYTLGDYVKNPACTVPRTFVEKAETFIASEVSRFGRDQQLPSSDGGYVRVSPA